MRAAGRGMLLASRRRWVQAAGCVERGLELGYPAEECEESELHNWVRRRMRLMTVADEIVSRRACRRERCT